VNKIVRTGWKRSYEYNFKKITNTDVVYYSQSMRKCQLFVVNNLIVFIRFSWYTQGQFDCNDCRINSQIGCR